MTTIPRGMAMPPLTPQDITDFLYTYFKAEYAPIRSFFSTATAIPSQPSRWVCMGTELSPTVFRPANAQAQKDLATLDDYLRLHGLDATFVHGLVVRYARFDLHERLEKKLYESCREDLMVRKALKEKTLMDALWPTYAKSPADLVEQGRKVRAWYGDMFAKYFQYLHSMEDYKLRLEVEDRMRRTPQLNLVPFVEHLVNGPVEAVVPVATRGAGVVLPKASGLEGMRPEGRADRFEIRFDAPPYLSETQTKSVVRTTECLKCGTRRDVTVVISVDPPPGPVEKRTHTHSQSMGVLSNTSAPLARSTLSSSKAAAKYRPGSIDEVSEGKRETPSHQKRVSETQSFPYSDAGEDPNVPAISYEEKSATPVATSKDTDAARPSNARNSLSLNLLNLKWPRSSASTPSHLPATAPPAEAQPPNTEMSQRASSPPPTYSEPALNRAPSPTLLPLSPPPTSLLDSAVPTSSETGIEDDSAAYWGEMESAKEDDDDEEERERERARENARSPVMLELEGERNVWGDD